MIPVYALTQGIGQKQLRRLTRQAIDETRQTLTDPVPSSVLSDLDLVELTRTRSISATTRWTEMLADAIRRLAFDDLFFLQLGLIQRKRATEVLRGNSLAEGEGAIPELPRPSTVPADYSRNNEQSRRQPRSRWLAGNAAVVQGDVGSGKTVVAAASALQATRAGFQTAVMAPTEILAGQLRATLGTALREPRRESARPSNC